MSDFERIKEAVEFCGGELVKFTIADGGPWWDVWFRVGRNVFYMDLYKPPGYDGILYAHRCVENTIDLGEVGLIATIIGETNG